MSSATNSVGERVPAGRAATTRLRPLVTLELRVDRGAWCAVLARDEQRVELGGLPELIRYLELLAAEAARPAVRGLR